MAKLLRNFLVAFCILVPSPAFGGADVNCGLSSLCRCNWATLTANCSNARMSTMQLKSIPTNVTALIFDGNYVPQFSLADFAVLSKLKRLSLRNCNVSSIDDQPIDPHTAPPLDAVDLSSNNIPELIAGSFLPRTVRTLHLNDNKISSISSDTLAWLITSGIMILDLSNNDLRSLPGLDDAQLLQQSSIANLNLADNNLGDYLDKISQSEKNLFKLIQQLEVLDLSRNNITELHPFLVADIGNLRDLILSGNSISDLNQLSLRNDEHKAIGFNLVGQDAEFWFPHGLFSLRVIDLSHNNLSQLDVKIFSTRNFPYLQRLDLSFNPFNCNAETYMFFEAYLSLQAKSALYCRPNKPREKCIQFPKDLFRKDFRIVNVAISSNDSGYYCAKPSNLTGIHVLDFDCIGSCRVELIKRLPYFENWKVNAELIKGDGDSTLISPQSAPINCIKTLERVGGESTLKVAMNCERMNIGDASLEAVLRNLSDSVSILRLAKNRLVNLNVTLLRKLQHLELLNVSGNMITQVFGNQQDLPSSLVTIDYSYNKLRRLTPNMVPSRIQKLLLSNNLIVSIANGTFANGKAGFNLSVLDLSRNQLKRLIDDINGVLETSKLIHLNLSHNGLSSYFNNEYKLMIGLSRLENLEVLDLSYNDIDRIYAQDVQNLTKLSQLDLSHNRLPNLDATSFNALKLKRYGTDPNDPQQQWWLLPGTGLQSLRRLDLSYNAITGINVQFIDQFDNLESINLSYNPFRCDGELFFAVEMMKKDLLLNSTNGYICFSPPELQSQSIDSFTCSGSCWQRYQELQRRYKEEEQRGLIPVRDESLDISRAAMQNLIVIVIVAAAIVVVLILFAILWAVRRGYVQLCYRACLTRLPTWVRRPAAMYNTNSMMTTRIVQMDELEAETEAT